MRLSRQIPHGTSFELTPHSGVVVSCCMLLLCVLHCVSHCVLHCVLHCLPLTVIESVQDSATLTARNKYTAIAAFTVSANDCGDILML